jgi:hypothetical protein
LPVSSYLGSLVLFSKFWTKRTLDASTGVTRICIVKMMLITLHLGKIFCCSG